MPLTDNLQSALIGAGAGLLGNVFNVFGQQSANQSNMELAKYQYEKNLEMWNRQNEYNTPAAQVARLREANLNPVLAMSGGVTNQASSAPSYDRPQLAPYQVDASGLAQIGSDLIRARATDKQLGLMETQMDLNVAKTSTENMMALLRELQGTGKFMENQYMSEVYPLMKELMNQNVNLTGSKNKLVQEQVRLTQEEINQMPVRYALIRSQIENTDARTRAMYVETTKVALENILLEAKTAYADKIAYNEANILSSRLTALNKLNSLRDLDKWINETKLEFLPSIYRAQILKTAVDAGTGFLKFGAVIP